MNSIIIDASCHEDKIGIIENDELVEFYVERYDDKKLVGNIYRGRVVNVLSGMEAAFVDIGIGKNAYLYINDVLPKDDASNHVHITDLIKSGQDLLVQVIKESFGNKGPKVTAHITLPGRYLVLTPFNDSIYISRRIVNEKERERLKSIGEKIKYDGYGMIIRTASNNVSQYSLKQDFDYLVKVYKSIEKEKNFKPTPKLIYKDLDLIYQIIRDVFTDKVDELVINDEKKHKSILQFMDIVSPELKNRVKLFSRDEKIFNYYGVEKMVKKGLQREVFLKSGGYIIIDETEALTAIDVNTGKYIGNIDFEDTIFKTNLEASYEIAKQLRLRDIGGIIIIDFIDMTREGDDEKVIEYLKECLKHDRMRTTVVGMTKLGLVEMTRKKVRNRLGTKLLTECPTCKGRGKIFIE